MKDEKFIAKIKELICDIEGDINALRDPEDVTIIGTQLNVIKHQCVMIKNMLKKDEVADALLVKIFALRNMCWVIRAKMQMDCTK